MSILFTSKEGWILSHLQYLNDIYKKVLNDNGFCALEFNKMIFEINSQYLRQNQIAQIAQDSIISLHGKNKRKKRSNLLPQKDLEEVHHIKETFNTIMSTARLKGFFEKCTFYCYDVREIEKKMELNKQYDFILLDPPWWNKSIRRKKMKYIEASYKMMYNEELAKIPVGKLLHSNGIVAVWCTNASSHLNSISNEMFPSWGVTYRAKWYWIKVTQAGDTICNFNLAPGKQPYELLILGSALKEDKMNIPDGKLVVSVPSAVHSHKPPVTEIIKEYLPSEPKCLEIFARYLLPEWTSWGLEILKFQHLSLYQILDESKKKVENDTDNKKRD
ncbi:methyltransferase-like protein 4 isoform X4 [Harpegnathos saltator]|uniref:methyltransferase-like protein 4 isoform X4 n=1 Tax=Harpegnathos saltator TaxID=610380 RepID=UPI000DBEE539|nr:methyltransferase-like protein 4 isoform X4 [Harpegnathos saltator]